jgi:hypothetical protein
MVFELMQPYGRYRCWDEDKLREHFAELSFEDILQIPHGRVGTTDFIAWSYTKNGVFSVRSA